jgi:hypothetical protein
MLVTRDENIGIDKYLRLVQIKIESKLLELKPNIVSKIYPRAYVNDNKAEYSKNRKDYERLLYDDRLDIQTFFLLTKTSSKYSNVFQDCSLIISCDLVKMFGDKQRSDEKLRKLFDGILNDCYFIEIYDMERELTDVYKEFDLTNLDKSNINPRCVMRFNFNIRYNECNCC